MRVCGRTQHDTGLINLGWQQKGRALCVCVYVSKKASASRPWRLLADSRSPLSSSKEILLKNTKKKHISCIWKLYNHWDLEKHLQETDRHGKSMHNSTHIRKRSDKAVLFLGVSVLLTMSSLIEWQKCILKIQDVCIFYYYDSIF